MSAEPTRIEEAMEKMEEERAERLTPLFETPEDIANHLRSVAATLSAVAGSISSTTNMQGALTYVDWSVLLALCSQNTRVGKRMLGFELHAQVAATLAEYLQQLNKESNASRAAQLFSSAQYLIERQ